MKIDLLANFLVAIRLKVGPNTPICGYVTKETGNAIQKSVNSICENRYKNLISFPSPLKNARRNIYYLCFF